MDTWIVVVVALLSGFGAALVTTFPRISHEREERLRERMLTAADEFATGVFKSILGLRDADWASGTSEAPNAFDTASNLVDEAHARYPRIQLLFGPSSEADRAAAECVLWMRRALRSVTAISDRRPYHESIGNLHMWQARFASRAAEAIRPQPWRERMRAKLRKEGTSEQAEVEGDETSSRPPG